MRKDLSGIVEKNLERKKEKEGGSGSIEAEAGTEKPKANRLGENVLDHIVDMREYDVPYVMRCAKIPLGTQISNFRYSNISQAQQTGVPSITSCLWGCGIA